VTAVNIDFIDGGGCFTGGVLSVVTGGFTGTVDDGKCAGGFFTRIARGGSEGVGIVIGIGGNGRPGVQITDIEGTSCPGNTDDGTTGAANGPAFRTSDPSGDGR
jgi:hypothetical protein